MKIRKVDNNGDMVFGQPNDYYDNDINGVALLILDRLNLWLGTWFANTNEGMPYFEDMLGKKNIAYIESLIRMTILETTGVTGMERFECYFNNNTRNLIVEALVTTQYGNVTINQAVL